VYAGQRLSFAPFGKTTEGSCQGQNRDSGNPTVRDRREACGNVVIMGDGLRPIGKPLEIATVPCDRARATFLSRPSQDRTLAFPTKEA
jgi:hypothetical protein